mgnify:CR=1 FL=1
MKSATSNEIASLVTKINIANKQNYILELKDSKNDITLNDKVIIPADWLVGTLTIDEDGKNIEQLDLPTGEYYVKELETNVGFKLDEEKHDFT